jgi:site-specific recombinase XerD
MAQKPVAHLHQIALRKVDSLDDSLSEWIQHYLQLAVRGVRSEEVTRKVTLHLERFREYFLDGYGHERISTCLKRDVVGWQKYLLGQRLAASTINNHLASLSGFTTWVNAQAPNLFPTGDPTKGIGELALPPLEPRCLSDAQVQSLKSVCDRLPRFHELRGRDARKRADGGALPTRAHGRPWRDRAIVLVLLSTGIRREELTRLELAHVEPNEPDALRKARIVRVQILYGKGKSQGLAYLSRDARHALADYIEKERSQDETPESRTLFLSASSLASRRESGQMTPQAINQILQQIGRWHDGEVTDPERRISPLRPHDLRHTFGYRLARETGGDPFALERGLRHRNKRYIERYTKPPEAEAAAMVEDF